MKLFLPVYEKFTGEYQKCILFAFSVRTNWNKLFCESLWFSSPHSDFYWKFFDLINFFLAQLVETAFYVAIRTFWERILSCKIVFSIIFRIEWKFLRILMKFPRWVFQNWNIRVQTNILKKILLFEKDAFFVNLGHSKKNSRPLFRVFFDAVVETAFELSKRTLKGIRFFSGKNVFFHQFGKLRQNFQAIVKILTAGLSNVRFTWRVPANSLRE